MIVLFVTFNLGASMKDSILHLGKVRQGADVGRLLQGADLQARPEGKK